MQLDTIFGTPSLYCIGLLSVWYMIYTYNTYTLYMYILYTYAIGHNVWDTQFVFYRPIHSVVYDLYVQYIYMHILYTYVVGHNI